MSAPLPALVAHMLFLFLLVCPVHAKGGLELSHQNRSSQTCHPLLHWLRCPAYHHLVGWLRLRSVGQLSQAASQAPHRHRGRETSVSSVAVMSLISLCLMEGNLPLAHESTCSTLNCLPQSQVEGMLFSNQPYLRAQHRGRQPCAV